MVIHTWRWSLSAVALLSVVGSATASADDYCEGRTKAYEVRDGIRHVRSGPQLRAALCDTQGQDGTWVIVYVDDAAEINLTGESDIPLHANVTLRSGRGGLNPGALLYTDRLSHDDHPEELFKVFGDNVRVEGLRFRGPSDSKKRRQQHINAIEIRGYRNIQIVGNEFYHWTGAGVFIECYYMDPDNRCGSDVPADDLRSELNKNNADTIRITRNYFHDNRTQDRGYGVQLHRGAYSLIDRNTFRNNRHAIASGGEPRTGYIATLNFVYPDGSRYCKETVGIEGCWYEHHFDMHGSGPDGLGNEGGIGGEFVEISYNTIHGEQQYGFPGIKKTRAAFDLRGEPQDRVLFEFNVLSHNGRGEAVRESWKKYNCLIQRGFTSYIDPKCKDAVQYRGNRYSAVSDSSRQGSITGRAENGILDFDGDGIADSFFPTGAAWYYSSGQKTEWRYLNKSAVKLDGIKMLTRYDGNAKTDVLRISNDRLMISRDGVGPWEHVTQSEQSSEFVQ